MPPANRNLTTARVSVAVDRHTAFKADSHAAEGCAGLAGYGGPEMQFSRLKQRHGNADAGTALRLPGH